MRRLAHSNDAIFICQSSHLPETFRDAGAHSRTRIANIRVYRAIWLKP